MSKYIFLCVLLAGVAMSNGAPNWISNMGNMFQKLPENIAKARNIVIATVSKPVIEQCTNFKSMMGMTLSNVEGTDKEPKLDDVTLEFMFPIRNQNFKLATAARDILADGFYNASQKMYVFMHGWNSDPHTFNDTKHVLSNIGDCNVLALDATNYLKTSYMPLTSYVTFLARKLAAVLADLHKEGLNPQDIHLVGHSLGAHVGGFIGKIFQTLTGKKIGRITGLDPAAPCFTELDSAQRLSVDDAEFVDVMHTNAGLSGLEDAIGHVDFYPNGGGNQPGCMKISCNHQRGALFFAESITNPKAFLAVKCDSWNRFKQGACADGEVAPMGFSATPDHTGSFFLQTTRKSPYGLEMSGTKYDRFLPV